MSDSERSITIQTIGRDGPASVVPSEIVLLDAHRRVVAQDVGILHARIPIGLYAIRVRDGDRMVEKFVEIDAGQYLRIEIPIYVRSTAPVEHTYTSHEFQSSAVGGVVTRTAGLRLGEGARFAVFARNRVPRNADSGDLRIVAPIELSRLSLRSASGIADHWHVLDDGAIGDSALGWRGYSVDVNPGAFVLRWLAPRVQTDRSWQNRFRCIEQAIYIPVGWTLVLFVENDPEHGLLRQHATFELVRLGNPWHPRGYEAEETLAVEVALDGMRQGKVLLSQEQRGMLLGGKFSNPMLGILGAHALLHDIDRDRGLLRIIVRNLLDLVGPHPDVRALVHLAGLEGEFPFADVCGDPPMLHAGYRALLDADLRLRKFRTIQPGSLAERIAPRLRGEPPWTTWIPFDEQPADERTADTVQWVESTYDGLREWIAERPTLAKAGLRMVRSAGRSVDPAEFARPEFQQVVRALDRIRDADRNEFAAPTSVSLESTSARATPNVKKGRRVDALSVARVAGLPLSTVRQVLGQLSTRSTRLQRDLFDDE